MECYHTFVSLYKRYFSIDGKWWNTIEHKNLKNYCKLTQRGVQMVANILKEWHHGGELGIYNDLASLLRLWSPSCMNLRKDRFSILEINIVNSIVLKIMSIYPCTCIHLCAFFCIPLLKWLENGNNTCWVLFRISNYQPVFKIEFLHNSENFFTAIAFWIYLCLDLGVSDIYNTRFPHHSTYGNRVMRWLTKPLHLLHAQWWYPFPFVLASIIPQFPDMEEDWEAVCLCNQHWMLFFLRNGLKCAVGAAGSP